VTAQPTIRTVEVKPPSALAEGLAVLRAAFFIALFSLIAVYRQSGAAAPEKADLLPYQVLFKDLPPADQRVFRQIQEGMIEIENVRGQTGRWPPVEALASDGIPPFAPDPVDRERYTWSFSRRGLNVGYVGTPAPTSNRPRFLLQFVEPDPNVPPPISKVPVDEQHHTLSDGTNLHVLLWMHANTGQPPSTVAELPLAEGWTQLLSRPAANGGF